MTDTVFVMDCNGASPFRILGPGSDPDNPGFDDLIFDGNQQPLRVKQKGSIYVGVNPGFWDGPGSYAGASTPIIDPHPTKRHLVLANGWAESNTSSVRMLPRQFGYTKTRETSLYYEQEGIGVATDATKVWGLNHYSGKANWVYWYTEYMPMPGGGNMELTHWRIDGYNYNKCYVSYMVLRNVIG